jgi:phosphatidylglycerol:prolipoprotein diacylglycerol transferase
MAAFVFPDIDPVAFAVGPIAVRWYGLAYFVGILLGWRYARRLAADRRLWGGRAAPMTVADIDDFLLWLVLGIVLGGRLGYALFYQPAHYLDDPLAFFRVWEGGMSFHGGLLGTIAAMAGFAWKRGFRMLSLFDVAAAATPIGLFFGRIANFVNAELWGRVTEAPWGVVFCNASIAARSAGVCPAGADPRHPSQLYEAALEGVLLFLALRILTHRALSLRRPGLTGGAFIAGYGICRFAVEFVREPDAQLGFIAGSLTMGMLLSLPMILVGLGAVALALNRRPA